MYISELKIHGFKSFADKVSLKFGEGVTGIVGPNGCGKTNIVDAIRWVLGEQKYSVLRSGKMEDVIFNGADGENPLNVCEVYLTVHNNSGKLPVEYNDVEVGRRIYRNGESEYFLNRQTCRLKDIQDLFIDTGMGSDAYSVIELKMVEQILSDSGEDRKRMFEEAAGINKYKLQRKSALRKFEATHRDLERIKDIVAEVETKVHGLGLQLKRFKRHASLMEKLKEQDLSLARLQIDRYQKKASPLMEKIGEFQSLRQTGSSSQSQLEKELESLKTKFREIEHKLAEQTEALAELESQRVEKEQNILVWQEQIRSNRQTITRISAELEKNIHRLETLSTSVQNLEKEIRELAPATEEKLAEFNAQKSKYDEVEAKYREARQEEEAIQAQRWEKQKALSSQQSLMSRTETLLEDKGKRVDLLNERIKETDSQLKMEVENRNQLEKQKVDLETQFASDSKSLEQLEAGLEKIKLQRSDLTQANQSIQARIAALEVQKDFYQELIVSGEGHPEGIRYIFEHESEFQGIVGVLGDQIGVPDELQKATEAALGDFAHYLIVKTGKDSKAILKKARQLNIGELGIITAESLNNHKSTKTKNSSDRLLDRLQTDKLMTPILEVLIGHVRLVDDVAELKSEPHPGDVFVDRFGGRVEHAGIIHQSGISSEATAIGRRQKLDLLSEELQSLSQTCQLNKEKESALSSQISGQQQKTGSAREKVEQSRNQLNGIEEELLKLHYQHTRSLEQSKENKSNKETLEKEISDLKASLDALKPDLNSSEAKLQSVQDSVQKAQEKLAAIRAERDRVNTRSQELRIELINLENQRENLEMQKRSAVANREELTRRNEQIDTEKIELQEKIETLEKSVTETETGLETLLRDIEKKKSEVGKTRQRRDVSSEKLESVRQLIQDEQKSREKILEDLRQAELEVSELQQRMEIIREHIRDQYNLSVPDDFEVTVDENSLEHEIERIKRSIEKIGPVNMAVQEEYDEESARLELLITQRQDLIDAETNLRETIQRIDRIARKQFLETFDQIKHNYERLFPVFFEGGKGTLRLVGDPDPLESDVEVSALPPGKRNQSLRLLSAGEKSLTAISLLFAIYQYKPSPYCILDEVDAPLDDGNIRKFINVLKKFEDDTQFIVVTHNKMTMEGANVLYGVTMEKKGVSKLVSVNLN